MGRLRAWLTGEPQSREIAQLTTAIRLTVEYVGIDTLPPLPGWAWYDALAKYDPTTAEAFRRFYEEHGTVPRFERQVAEEMALPRDAAYLTRRPPAGMVWLSPRACHGNDAFCVQCSPRNPNRKAVPAP